MSYEKSIEAFEEAYRVIPGGVDSPVRAFSSVGGTPLFIERAEGAPISYWEFIRNNSFG